MKRSAGFNALKCNPMHSIRSSSNFYFLIFGSVDAATAEFVFVFFGRCTCLNHEPYGLLHRGCFPICHQNFIYAFALRECSILFFFFRFRPCVSLSLWVNTLDWIFPIEQCTLTECKWYWTRSERASTKDAITADITLYITHNVMQSITNSCWRFVFFFLFPLSVFVLRFLRHPISFFIVSLCDSWSSNCIWLH